ncbi:sensor histidine kinase KdpD [Romboutsia weinsteinii]|uniref:histidine kinase n=1 Tax=Romboutsia weinsteinii TaxID=2020949 RepID=A0A371J6L1_9FIRM|nr:sensor histidine kinase KdpD [Romboutsia weinsteinii]RDY28323.1 sensor histidine kinase KdpD [Romboutsia weinsteinii]
MDRPDPRSLLEKIKDEESKLKRGQLKVFFGYAAGVGKTYSMLESAQNLKKYGVDVVVGYIEPHTRPETLSLLDGLEILPVKEIKYKTIDLKEFNLDAALKRNPELMLVDEFAHTNVRGLRHNKRWQDIEELLLAGIDVYTTVNVQHLESLNDIVEIITKISVKETIPDRLLDNSTQLELIDIEPDVLLQRFNEGKIYKKDQALKAKDNFFIKDNLIALREIALRKTAERVNKEVQISRLSKGEVTVIPTSDTIMACVGPSPSSTKIIRTASRIAYSSLSKWIALYITTPESNNLNETQRNQLKSNLDLAKKLGAEIVVLHGDNLVEQIIRYAKMRNVTKIVIGRNHSNHKFINKILKKDVVDKLIEEVYHIDVHVIPYKSGTKDKYIIKKENSIKSKFKITYIDFIKLSIITIISTIIAYSLRSIGFASENILLIYILNVVFISVCTKGYTSGIISSILNIILINYLFTEPLHTFSIDDPNYIITLLVFCIVGITTSTLTSRIQHQAETYSKREENTQMLYQISRSFLRVSSKEDIINKGLELLFISLSRDVVCYTKSNSGNDLILFEENRNLSNKLVNDDEKAVASWVLSNATIAGKSTDTLPGSKGYYMPIIGINSTLGVIGISCYEKELDNEDICVIEAIVAQMSIALDREILSQIKESAKNELEKERFISSLLRAISHDIRTPLAGISGTLSTIMKNKEEINDDLLYELIDGAYEDSQWLIRLVENLLSMTRIDENKLEVKKKLELAEEVISSSLNHIKRRIENMDIEINIPNDPMFVPMDAKLIEQVLINLIDNAIKYAGEQCKIKINVYEKNNQAQFEVCDNGPGIPSENIKYVFDRFFTGEVKCSDSRKGVGLGLPICKSIIEAHKGEIYSINNKQKGATFGFNLPMHHEGGLEIE